MRSLGDVVHSEAIGSLPEGSIMASASFVVTEMFCVELCSSCAGSFIWERFFAKPVPSRLKLALFFDVRQSM